MEDQNLIVAVCSRPVLYDTTMVSYRDRNKKERAWVDVAEDTGFPVDVCRRKWKSLRDRETSSNLPRGAEEVEEDGAPETSLSGAGEDEELEEAAAGPSQQYSSGNARCGEQIPPTVTSTAAQESIKDRFQAQIMPPTVYIEETRERPEVQSCNMTSGSSACEVHCVRGQSGTSSAKEGIGEVGVQHLAVFSADLASETESRSGCQSSRAAPNDSACEVHCVRGQSGTSSAKEGIGEVCVQHQEVSSPVFSADLASGGVRRDHGLVRRYKP
ncbi:unnamed protein product [Arctogadus glacialis]